MPVVIPTPMRKTHIEKESIQSNNPNNKPMPPNTVRPLRKTRIGKVLSNKPNKTIVVAIERKIKHPLYGKYIRKTTKLAAHDETNDCKMGDTVKLMETKPLSKTKRWRLVEIIKKQK